MSRKSRSTTKPIHTKAPHAESATPNPGSDLYPLLILAAVWMLAAILINPKGNFPLNDDWCYGKAVFNLLKHHEIRFVGITTMTLIAQVLWGALFCLILGPTFTALRISTLTLGLAGVLAVYGILREIRAPRWAALFGALVVALNPLYLCLSYSFMTDVPFAAVALMAVYVYLRALRTDSTRLIVAGTAISVVAVLIRQFGIILPIAFACAHIVKNGFSLRSLVRSLVPIAVAVLVMAGFTQIMKASGRLPFLYNIQATRTSDFLKAGPMVWGGGIQIVFRDCFMYLGGFLFPFLAISFLRQITALSIKQVWINLCISAAALIAVYSVTVRAGKLMPLNNAEGDYLQNLGIGPLTLRDYWILKIPNHNMASEGFWTVVTIICCLGGALLFWHLMAAFELVFTKREKLDRPALAMILAAAFMALVPLLPLTKFVYFDRYFLFSTIMFIGVICMAAPLPVIPNRTAMSAGIILLGLIAYFSIAGTHDYMAWNRLRWQAANDLMTKMDVQPREIDGGYEFNGWYNYRENDIKQRWWRDVYDDYIIAFGPTPGYEEVQTYTFNRWLPPGKGTIKALSRIPY